MPKKITKKKVAKAAKKATKKKATKKRATKKKAAPAEKSMESWIWDAACSIRGAAEASKYKEYILPLIFVKRLCDVFDDELDRIALRVKTREKAFRVVKADKKLVRFYLPLKPDDPEKPVWSVIRELSDDIGETLTTQIRNIAKENKLLKGIIDRVDFNATTHGQRDLDDGRLSNLIEKISEKRLGLDDVEPDIIGRSYEYLIRKFAENSGQSAGEFYTPKEVGIIMAEIMQPEPGMTIYDPCCGSAGLLIKCDLVLKENQKAKSRYAPLDLFGQEYTPETWAMANMNMIIHDLQGEIEIGDTFRSPKFPKDKKRLSFDRVVANPMWNQSWFDENDYDADELGRFPKGAGFPGKSSADWGWVQHIAASLNDKGRAAIVLDTGAASRGSGNAGTNKEREVRKWFIEQDLIEGVIYMPENLFYNTTAPGILLFINKSKPKKQQGKIMLVNASREYEKGEPKNFISDSGIKRIATTFLKWKEVEKFSRVVEKAEIEKNDFNISPSRYVHTGDEATFRPLDEILSDLESLESETKTVDRTLSKILNKIGV